MTATGRQCYEDSDYNGEPICGLHGAALVVEDREPVTQNPTVSNYLVDPEKPIKAA